MRKKVKAASQYLLD